MNPRSHFDHAVDYDRLGVLLQSLLLECLIRTLPVASSAALVPEFTPRFTNIAIINKEREASNNVTIVLLV